MVLFVGTQLSGLEPSQMFTSESTVGFADGSPINRVSLLGGCEFCLVFELIALSLGSCSVELTLDKDLFRVCRQSADSAIRFTDVCDLGRQDSPRCS